MALQSTMELESGITVTDAYHKIVQMTVTAFGSGCEAYLEIRSYVNQTKAEENAPPVAVRTYTMPAFDKLENAVTAAGQAYGYLKTLPDFDGATDI